MTPPLTLVRADGKPAGDIRVQRWRTGEIELVGIMGEPERRPRQKWS